MASKLQLRVPRTKSLLGVISLQTGTEFLSLMLAFNKLTGVYGVLAILTGFELSVLQLTTYIYSIIVLVALGVLIPHIRKQSPLECLALAWIHILDTAISCACTAFFAVQWYFNTGSPEPGAPALESGTPDASGFAEGAAVETAAAMLKRAGQVTRMVDPSMPHDTAFSLVLIAAFSLVRIYFCFVVAGYAQQVLTRYIDQQLQDDRPSAKHADGPFAKGGDDGEGWRGRLGRAMISVGRTYWLDHKDQEDWARSMNERFRKPQSPISEV